MIRRPPRSTQSRSSAASDVYKRQSMDFLHDGVIDADTRLSGRWYTSYQAAVALGNQIFLEKIDRMLKVLLAFGKKNQSACIHINPVAKINILVSLIFT